MNEYGQLARQHWSRWLPGRVEAIADRDAFFTDLGEQVQAQVLDVAERLEAGAAGELAGLGYVQRVGELTAIRAQAREVMLADLVLLDPEPAAVEGGEESDGEVSDDLLGRWVDPLGMPRDREHWLWGMVEDEGVSTQEFAAAASAWEAGLWRALEDGDEGGGMSGAGSRSQI